MKITNKKREINAKALSMIADKLKISIPEMTMACIDLNTIAIMEGIKELDQDKFNNLDNSVGYLSNAIFDILSKNEGSHLLDVMALLEVLNEIMPRFIAELDGDNIEQ